MSYDVIIAGAGPSGLTAAMTAAREGLSVLLVETKEHIFCSLYRRHSRLVPECEALCRGPCAGYGEKAYTDR